MPATYWIYENPLDVMPCTIHAGTCPFCNDGRGTGRRREAGRLRRSRWLGPYRSVREAITVCAVLGESPHFCQHCRTGVDI